MLFYEIKKRLLLASICVFLLIIFFLGFPKDTQAATYTVLNTNASGAGSFLQAVTDANNNPGNDLVTFNIPTSDTGYNGSWWVITTAPPTLNDGTLVDGYSQPGASMNTNPFGGTLNTQIKIELKWTSTWWGLGGDGTTIRGLSFTQGSGAQHGLVLEGDNEWIYGNFFGIKPDGTCTAWTQGYQLWYHFTENATIGNNGDGNNDLGEINVFGCAASTQSVSIHGNQGRYAGNYFGVGPNLNDIGSKHGMAISGGTSSVVEGNMFGNMQFDGVNWWNSGLSNNSIVQNNYFGTDPTGTLSFPQARLGCAGSTGSLMIQNNIVANSGTSGIYLGGCSNCTVQYNTVYNNSVSGIAITNWAELSSGNTNNNIFSNTIYNNKIGVGIIENFFSDYDNKISQNSIYNNEQLGIDIYPGDVSQNDLGDVDDLTTAHNYGMNFPVIIRLIYLGDNQYQLQGTLDSPDTGDTSPPHTIEAFLNSSGDPSGYGEGEIYLGSTTNDGDGSTWTIDFYSEEVCASCTFSTTATDSNGNTSEFSTMFTEAIEGYVFNDINKDEIQQGNENGIPGVTIKLYDDGNNLLLSTTTNAIGYFFFLELEDGTYTVVEIDPTGYLSTTSNSVTVEVTGGNVVTVSFGDYTPESDYTSDYTPEEIISLPETGKFKYSVIIWKLVLGSALCIFGSLNLPNSLKYIYNWKESKISHDFQAFPMVVLTTKRFVTPPNNIYP